MLLVVFYFCAVRLVSDLFGNHIVGFPTSGLIYELLQAPHEMVKTFTSLHVIQRDARLSGIKCKMAVVSDFKNAGFRKIITRYRRIGYNLNVMRQSACLVFNPIMVDNYAAFFNCTPVGRASDSMMAPT